MVLRSLAALPEFGTQVRVIDQPLERVDQSRGIAGGDDQSVDSVGDHLGHPAHRRGHNGDTDTGRLHQADRQTLLTGGQHEQVGGGQQT